MKKASRLIKACKTCMEVSSKFDKLYQTVDFPLKAAFAAREGHTTQKEAEEWKLYKSTLLAYKKLAYRRLRELGCPLRDFNRYVPNIRFRW
jgi:hypothetical protein